MVTWLLGHEGRHLEDSMVNMGTAVLRVGNFILNGSTGHRIPYSVEQVNSLVTQESISLFSQSYRVPVGDGDRPYVVRLNLSLADYLSLRVFSVTKKWNYILSRTHRDGTMNLLFREFSYVEKWIGDLIPSKLSGLEQNFNTNYGRSIIRGLSILNSDHPELQALQAASSRNPQFHQALFISRNGPSSRFDAVFDRLMERKVKSVHEL